MKDIFDLNNKIQASKCEVIYIHEVTGRPILITNLNKAVLFKSIDKEATLKEVGQELYKIYAKSPNNVKEVLRKCCKFMIVDLENDEMFICRDIEKNIWNKWANILGV